MVFYFESAVVPHPVTIFMGKDKYENEDLIKFGFPEDVWFHVDNFSSAHVYVRINKGQTIEDIPEAVVNDAAQLVKANSIQGNKLNNIDIVYTMWKNLKKLPSMEVGQVAFYNNKEVRKIRVEKRMNEIVNRLNKTKKEDYPDLQLQREKRDEEDRQDKKKMLRAQQARQREETKREEELAQLRSYAALHKTEKMTTNYDDGNESDEFM